jgi:hypothetical protein
VSHVVPSPAAPAAASPYSRVAIAAGVLAAIVFFGLAFPFGGVLWIVAAALGAISVAAAVSSRRRREAGSRRAFVGALPGVVVLVWFVAFVIVEALT